MIFSSVRLVSFFLWVLLLGCDLESDVAISETGPERAADHPAVGPDNGVAVLGPGTVRLENGVAVGETLLTRIDRGEPVTVTVMLRPDEADAGAPGLFRRQSLALRAQAAFFRRLAVNPEKVVYRFQSIPAVQLTLDRELLNGLEQQPSVTHIEAAVPLRVDLAEGTALIGADRVQAGAPPLASGYDGTGQVVAVIDSGIDYNHPDLGGCYGEGCKVRGGYDFVNDDADPMDDHGHGTSVAGIIASASTVMPGVAPGASLMALKVIGSDGSGMSDAMDRALDWVATNGPDLGITVVNLSFTGEDVFQGSCDGERGYAATTAAIDAITDLGIPVFVCSGNSGCPDRISAPACVASAISVGAVYDAPFVGPLSWVTTTGCTQERDCGGRPCCIDGLDPDETTTNMEARDVMCFTNSGPTLDLLAPAFAATTTALGGGLAEGFSGTSAATPYAVGATALLLEAAPELSPEAVRDTLARETDHFSTDPKNDLSFPVIDAFQAVVSVGVECECEIDADCDDGDDSTEDRCESCRCVDPNNPETGDGGAGADLKGSDSCGCSAVGNTEKRKSSLLLGLGTLLR
jgi:subtilisin family serine protease